MIGFGKVHGPAQRVEGGRRGRAPLGNIFFLCACSHALAINTLGGTTKSLLVNMDTTIVEICERLSHLAPWLHEFQICSGGHVLCDGSVADAGLQRIAKALAKYHPVPWVR